VEVEGFDGLPRSDESEELRFFGREELSALDAMETARPTLLDWSPARSQPGCEAAGVRSVGEQAGGVGSALACESGHRTAIQACDTIRRKVRGR
jgi:hypothetical protein